MSFPRIESLRTERYALWVTIKVLWYLLLLAAIYWCWNVPAWDFQYEGL